MFVADPGLAVDGVRQGVEVATSRTPERLRGPSKPPLPPAPEERDQLPQVTNLRGELEEVRQTKRKQDGREPPVTQVEKRSPQSNEQE